MVLLKLKEADQRAGAVEATRGRARIAAHALGGRPAGSTAGGRRATTTTTANWAKCGLENREGNPLISIRSFVSPHQPG